jgi:T-complex protein 1 subunit theta
MICDPTERNARDVSQMGDATNTVLIFAGELLKQAEPLLIMGLHPSEVIQGFELAAAKALLELESASRPAPAAFRS